MFMFPKDFSPNVYIIARLEFELKTILQSIMLAI